MATTKAAKKGNTTASARERAARLKVAARNAEVRHTATLRRAWEYAYDRNGRKDVNGNSVTETGLDRVAEAEFAVVRAAVFAVIPGKQNNRNAGAFVGSAVTAAARAIRRGV